MKLKKFLSLFLVFVVLISSVSLTAYCTSEDHTKSIDVFSDELDTFIVDNFQYASKNISPEDDEIIFEEIETNRLIVSTYSNDKLTNTCGAIDILEGYNNWHILQYDSVEATACA